MMPELVLLDTREAVLHFKKQVPVDCGAEAITLETVHAVLNCLHTKTMAEYELREYIAQIEFGVFDDDAKEDEPSQDERLREAKLIYDLGMELKDKVDALGLYDEEGFLLYHFYEEYYDFGNVPVSNILLIKTS